MGTRCTLLRPGIVDYQDAWQLQRRIAAEVRNGADPTLILLQHPPTYTLGARGGGRHLRTGGASLLAGGASLVQSDRGGDVTFHGPGQIIAYPIINLRTYGQGPVWYVRALESALISTLARFGVTGARTAGRPGVWCGSAKIAAIGVRVSRGVTTHGLALNVNTELAWFERIVPCGLADAGVTSMSRELGRDVELRDVEDVLADSLSCELGLDLVAEESPALAIGAQA